MKVNEAAPPPLLTVEPEVFQFVHSTEINLITDLMNRNDHILIEMQLIPAEPIEF